MLVVRLLIIIGWVLVGGEIFAMKKRSPLDLELCPNIESPSSMVAESENCFLSEHKSNFMLVPVGDETAQLQSTIPRVVNKQKDDLFEASTCKDDEKEPKKKGIQMLQELLIELLHGYLFIQEPKEQEDKCVYDGKNVAEIGLNLCVGAINQAS